MIRAFLSVSTVFAIGVPLTLFVNVMLARWLSVEDFGSYSFAYSLASILALPVSGGLVLLLTREVSSALQSDDQTRYARLLRTTLAWIAIATLCIGIVYFGVQLVRTGQIDAIVLLTFSLVPGLALIAFGEGLAKGVERPALGEALRQIIAPAVFFIGAAILWFTGALSSETALLAQSGALLLAGLFALVVSIQIMRRIDIGGFASTEEIRRLGIAFASFAMITGLAVLISQFATVALGILSDKEQVAYLKVAERGSQLVALPLMFVNAIMGPKLVRAFEGGDMAELRRLSRVSTRLAFAVALPIAAVLIIGGKPLIAMTFGVEYREAAYTPLVWLCLAQLFFVLMGIPGMILAMTNFHLDNLLARTAGALVLAVSVVALAPAYGALGAALGVAIGLVAIKLFTSLSLLRRLGFISGPL